MNLHRIIRGIGANAYAAGLVIAVQLLSVPILIAEWGLDGFGVWLILSAIPAYLALSNLGVSVVTGNRMAAEISEDGKDHALTSFATGWQAVLWLSAFLVLAGMAAVLFWPDALLPDGAGFTNAELRWSIAGLVVATAGYLVMDSLLAGYRATGLYATGTLIMSSVHAAERFAVLLMATLGEGVAAAAAAMAAVRVLSVIAMRLHYRRARPDMQPNARPAKMQVFKAILPQSLGLMMLPAGFAFSLQGVLIVLAAVAGPAAVGVFGALRTFTRFSVQAMNLISTALLPEFAMVAQATDRAARSEIFGFNFAATMLLAVGAFAGYWLLGPQLFELWTGEGERQDWACLLYILAAGAVVHGVWLMLSNMLIAAGRQLSFTPHFLVLAILVVALAGLLEWDAVQIAWALLVTEIAMIVIVLRAVRSLSIDGLGQCLRLAYHRLANRA